MGLDDFVTSKEYDIGDVKARKKAENIHITRSGWKNILVHYPHLAWNVCTDGSESDTKVVVEMLDEIITDGVSGVSVSDEEIEEIEREREEIVDEYLRDNN